MNANDKDARCNPAPAALTVEELRALARDLIRRLPDDEARQLLDEVIRDRAVTGGSAGREHSPFR